MPISNRLIRVHMPADGVASAYAETDLIVPHDVRKMTVKGIVYKSTKNVSNQDAEFLTVFSNLVDGPLGFVLVVLNLKLMMYFLVNPKQQEQTQE